MASPNKVLANNPFSRPSLCYPETLGSVEQSPYIIFSIRDSVAKGAKEKGTIALYMPPDLKVSYTTKYEEHDMPIDQFMSLVKYTNSDVDLEDKLKSFFGGVAVGVLDKVTGANAMAALERYQGRIINPHQAVLFKGVEPRQFSFSFSFFAKNMRESEIIKQIIHVFKYAQHPSMVEPGDSLSKRFFYYPENFLIGLFSPEDRYLWKMGLCALETVEVDYGGSAVPSFFARSGAPVHVTMALKFKELEIMTKERIKTGF